MVVLVAFALVVVAVRRAPPAAEPAAARPAPPAPALPDVPPRCVCAEPAVAGDAPEELEVVEENDEIDEIGEDVERDDELDPDHPLARIATIERALVSGGALLGHVRDAETGERLPGVTVIASRGDAAHQVAITDETGWYLLPGLAAGAYTVTMYYADRSVEHTHVVVGVGRLTPLDGRLPEPHGITFSGGTYLDNEYVLDE